MAKSKSGGTRSYIRGRVGADVYSIGKDAKGKKQQVVRSLAETVANPQTIAQMRGRMIMSTIMQAQSALKPIIDHSFDNVSGVQPNLSEFIRRNYALIKADVAAHPASNNTFGLNAYQEKGAKQGAYVISDGKAVIPAAVVLTKGTGVVAITLASDNITMAGLKAALGFGSDDYLTLVGIDANGNAEYCRYHINQSLADSTAISAENIDSVFEIDGNAAPTVAIASNVISITLAAVANCCAIIVTKKTNSGFEHSKATLGAGTGLSWNADAALPTYPVGEQKFLNGGDQSFSPAASGSDDEGGSDDPEPSPSTNPTLTVSGLEDGDVVAITAGGSTVQNGAAIAAGTQVQVVLTLAENHNLGSVSLNGSSLTATGDGQEKTVTFQMPSANSTLTYEIEITSGGGGGEQPGEGD